MWAALLATRREVAADRSARFLEAILAGAVKGHRLDVVQIVNVRPPELCGDYIRYQSGFAATRVMASSQRYALPKFLDCDVV